jgi:type II secretory pathway pseudopilin PulG
MKTDCPCRPKQDSRLIESREQIGLTAGRRGVRLNLGPIARTASISVCHFGGIAMRRLINVLVVILILVVAGGLVLSAIPRIQAAAARTQCQNNLKQIGLALHNYHDNYGMFPSATVPSENLPCGKRLSWQLDAIPFMTQIGHLLVNREKAWDAEENYPPRVRFYAQGDREVEGTVGKLEFLRCPSNATNAALDPVGLTDYIGISGVGPDAAEFALCYPGAGFFGCQRRLKLEDIKDGTENTLVVAETNRDNGPWTAGGFPTTRGLDPARGPYLGTGGQFGSGHRSCTGWFSLSSAVITNVVYADGSVRGLTDSVSPQVLEALVTLAGGEDIGPEG